MLYLVAQGFAHCSWVGDMTIRCHPFRRMTNNRKSIVEKQLSCLHIAFLTQTSIHQIAICVNSAIQITPFSLDPHIRAHPHTTTAPLVRVA
jgi:hypothetical protein